MDQSVLMDPDIDEGSEICDIRNDSGEFHPNLQVLDNVDILRETELVRRFTRIQPGLCQFFQNIMDRRKTKLFLYIFIRRYSGAKRLVPHQHLGSDAQIGSHPVDDMVSFGMDRGIIKRIAPVPDPEKAGTLLEGLFPKPRDFLQFLPGLETAMFFPVGYDISGKDRTDPGNILQEIRAGRIEIHTDTVYAALYGIIEFLTEEVLVDIMLVLSDAQRLRIDLDKFSQGIHQTTSDRNGTPHRHILIREFE